MYIYLPMRAQPPRRAAPPDVSTCLYSWCLTCRPPFRTFPLVFAFCHDISASDRAFLARFRADSCYPDEPSDQIE